MDGDHSYGIYLYHSPILQTFVWLTGGAIAWWQCFILTFATVVPFAILSWRYIEAPALSLKAIIAPVRRPSSG